MIELSKQEKLLSKTELRSSIIQFTWPCLAELMLMSLISIVNISMVGHLGTYALSAVGLTSQPANISAAVFQAFNIGATALITRFIGANDYKGTKSVIIQTLLLNIFSGIVLSIVGYIWAKETVILMGAKDDSLDAATVYMKYIAIGFFFQAIPTAVSSVLRGAGDSKSPMVFNIIANIVNVLFGLFLIHGLWFFPSLGVEGAGIASVLAKGAACVLSIIALFRSQLPIAYRLKDFMRLDIPVMKRILRIGSAAAGEQFVTRMGFFIYSRMIAELGTVPLAAHQVCSSISGLSFNFGQALGFASTSFIGRNLGSNNPEKAEQYGRELRRIAMFLSVFISLLFFFGGKYIAGIFTRDAEVIQIVISTLRIMAFMTAAQNAFHVMVGAFRGAGDTKWAFYTTSAGLMLRIPVVYVLLYVFGFGLEGAWAGAVTDQCVRYVLAFFRFRTGKWKTVTV